MRLDHVVQSHLRASGAPTASLKVAQRIVRNGEIRVDDLVVQEPKQQIVPGVEIVALVRESGARTQLDTGDHVFYIMHKPAGYVCQRHPHEKSVYDLVPSSVGRTDLACVGRLDRDTTGTLLFGTDGGLQSMLLFPTSNVWKVYHAEVCGVLHADAVARFASGLVLEDGTRCAPATLEVLEVLQPVVVEAAVLEAERLEGAEGAIDAAPAALCLGEDDATGRRCDSTGVDKGARTRGDGCSAEAACPAAAVGEAAAVPAQGAACGGAVRVRVRVTLHEGFFHQVKRMIASCGGCVVRLHRERFGLLSAADLDEGTMRQLSAAERASLAEMLPHERVCMRELPTDAQRRPRPPSAAEVTTEEGEDGKKRCAAPQHSSRADG